MSDTMKCKNCDMPDGCPDGFCSNACRSAYPRRNEEIRRQALEEAAQALMDKGYSHGHSTVLIVRDLIELNHTAGLKQGDEMSVYRSDERPGMAYVTKLRITAVLGPDTIKVERVR